jgi:hypothetical protein
VELSLVAGAPHSFIQQLSEPFYGRRPVVPLPESVQLSPQTHGAMLSGGSGRLIGTITDPTGARVSGANVNLRDENNALVAQTTADSAGNYEFSGIPTGNYRAEMQSPGFQKTLIAGLNVSPGDNRADARLQVGSVAESVTVSAGGPVVETESADVVGSAAGTGGGSFRAGVAKRPHVSDLALNGRNLSSLSNFGPVAPPNLDELRSKAEAGASGKELGDLFEYKLKDRVTLKKNQSGMVPIVQADIEAEKISLWSSSTGSGRPLRGLWVINTSPLTLDGGSFSVLENEVFAGEGLTDPIKPNERRLVSYATNLGLLVDTTKQPGPGHVSRVTVAKGVMTRTSELRERVVYTARNQTASAQVLIIEHPARGDWQLVSGSKEPEEKAAGVYRFRVEVPPQATASLPVEERRSLYSTYQLTGLDENQIAVFALEGAITPEMRKSFEAIAAQKAAVANLEEEMENRQKDIDRIVEDQGRLRENMKALRGTAEEKALLQRYTKQLDEQETQLATLRKNIENTEAQRDAANLKLQSMIQDLQFDATF